jgi:hypothetical protein
MSSSPHSGLRHITPAPCSARLCAYPALWLYGQPVQSLGVTALSPALGTTAYSPSTGAQNGRPVDAAVDGPRYHALSPVRSSSFSPAPAAHDRARADDTSTPTHYPRHALWSRRRSQAPGSLIPAPLTFAGERAIVRAVTLQWALRTLQDGGAPYHVALQRASVDSLLTVTGSHWSVGSQSSPSHLPN